VNQSTVFLKVLRGEDQGKGWELDPRQVYVLGRSRSCNLRFTDGTISASHARIQCAEEVWTITDLESSHGTRVNNQRILARKPLFDRDLINLGKTLLEFREYEELDPPDIAEIDRGVRLPS
jgi:pSer/pThr/pTyr-binding forkhead associated (FHA) protein